jgi:sigma-B regulation protein RsbU (phosphoserine phosphatase)
MSTKRRPWQEELAIVDRTMREISGISDPEEMVQSYYEGIGDLLPIHDYVSTSRRGMQPPGYLVTRSSRFEEDLNPWTDRDKLPRLTGGILGEITYANEPVIIDNLPVRLSRDDPGWFYLQGFDQLIALPSYDNGEALNVTCLLTQSGSDVDRSVIPILHWQSGLFGRGTQNLVLKNQLAGALKSLDRELQTVGEIQKSLLPSELPKIPTYDLAAFYQTSARAGGDYYDFFPLHDGAGWGIFIADVSGHGTPAAVLMAITHAIAHAQPGTHTPPVELLAHLNRQLTRSYTRGGTFVTAFYAVLDPKTGTLTYSRAGHNPPRLVRGRSVSSLDANGGLPLGIIDDECFYQSTVTLEKGDLLLLYTDGITEASAPVTVAGAQRELFGMERLDNLLLTCADSTAQETIDCVCAAIGKFVGTRQQSDDQTLIAIRRTH